MQKNSFIKNLNLFKPIALFIVSIYALSVFIANIMYYKYDKKDFFLFPKITFGIDIVGGNQLTVLIDTSDIVSEQKNNNYEYIVEYCKEKDIVCDISDKGGNISVDIMQNKENDDKLLKKNKKTIIKDIRQIFYNYDIEFINNSNKHFSMLIKMTDKTLNNIIADVTDKAITVLKNRIDGVGVKEIAIQRYGNDKIVILIPNGVNINNIKNIVNTTAKLNFHLMDSIHVFSYKPKEIAKKHVLFESYKTTKEPLYYLVEEKPSLGGDVMANVQPSIDGISNAINFRLNAKGTKKFANITKNNIGRLLAIVLDDKVLMAPMINTPIVGGSGSITGHFTTEEVQNLSVLLKSGSLPAKISIINERQIGSIFEKQILSNANISITVCFLIVLLIMVTRYKHFGAIAFLALILNFLFTFAILSVLGFTLTLPGIAGFILMLGMALDANILIYEKMKELKRNGIHIADVLIKNGFSQAIATIIDSNITTVVAAISLFSFGGSFIKGFSITLILGIMCSLFTAVNITKMIIETIYKNKKVVSI